MGIFGIIIDKRFIKYQGTYDFGALLYKLKRENNQELIEIVFTSDQNLLTLMFMQDDFYSEENMRKFYRAILPYNEDEFKNAKPLRSFL